MRLRIAVLVLIPLCASLASAQDTVVPPPVVVPIVTEEPFPFPLADSLGAIDVALYAANPRAAVAQYLAVNGAQWGVTDTAEISRYIGYSSTSPCRWGAFDGVHNLCRNIVATRQFGGVPVESNLLMIDFYDSSGTVLSVRGRWDGVIDPATPVVPLISGDSAIVRAAKSFRVPVKSAANNGLLLWGRYLYGAHRLVWDIHLVGAGYTAGYPRNDPRNGVPCDYTMDFVVDALTGEPLRSYNRTSGTNCLYALKPTEIDESAGPSRFAILSVAPNPSNPSTVVAFSLDRAYSSVALDVFDASGRRVRTLSRGSLDAGAHQVVWDGNDDGGRSCAAGAYVIRLSAEGRTSARRVVLAR